MRTSPGCSVPVAPRLVACAVGVVGCGWGSLNAGSAGWRRALLPGLRWALACPWGRQVLPLHRPPACGAGSQSPHSGGWGWPSAVVRGVWCQAPSLFRPFISGGGRSIQGPLSVHNGRCGWYRGPRTGPTACAPASWRCVPWGWPGGAPWEGRHVPLRGVSEVWCSSSLGCPPSGRAVGFRCPCCGRERAGVGARHRPFGVHALRGAASRGGGGWRPSRWVALCRCEGNSGVGCRPSLGLPSLGAGGQGLLPMCPGHGWCGHGGPGTGPTDCTLASRRCALWERRGGSPGGAALRRCEGRLRQGARPSPAARHWGGLLGPAALVLWARVCGCGGPALSLWLACPAGGCVPRGIAEGRPRGGCPPAAVGGAWCQALSLSRRPAPGSGRQGPAARVSRARMVWVWDTQHWPHSVRSCDPALPAERVAGGLPLGGCLAPLRGASEVGRSPFPGCPSWRQAVRVRCPRAVGAGVRKWAPGTVHLPCMPCGGLRTSGVVGSRPGGGGVLPPL